MTASADDIRKRLHELADQLPADATWDDVIEEARFLRAVEAGIAAAERGGFASDDELRGAFATWGVKI
jgi:predicted transcriptional regulator